MLDVFAAQIDSGTFGPAKFTNFGELFSNIILILTSIAAAVTFIFVVIAGIKFVTSSGDEKGVASAKAALTYAIIGFAVTVLAFVIMQLVQYFIGSTIPID